MSECDRGIETDIEGGVLGRGAVAVVVAAAVVVCCFLSFCVFVSWWQLSYIRAWQLGV